MTEFETAAAIARCHTIIGHRPAPQPAQSGVNPLPPQNTLERICDQALRQSVTIIPDRAADPCDPWVLANRISVLEHRLSAMTQERDHALLRMEVAIATSHGLIDAEVQRRIQLLGNSEHVAPAFPANALRHQRQSGGLLSTADAGRVRLGGYAPTL